MTKQNLLIHILLCWKQYTIRSLQPLLLKMFLLHSPVHRMKNKVKQNEQYMKTAILFMFRKLELGV